MQYRTLGRTGVQVSSLALGAMNFGPIGDTDQSTVDAIVGTALDHGINLVDTADFYGAGASEQMLGRALAGRRDDVVLATKLGLPMSATPNHSGSSRRWIMTALDASLERLGVDHVDLLQIHRWDPRTADEQTLGALTDLQRAGKIRYFGTSTFPAYRLIEARWAAERHGHGAYVTEQPSYSILQRGIERDVLPVAEAYALGVLVWSPLASGWLSGAISPEGARTRRSTTMPQRFDLDVPVNRTRYDAVQTLSAIAADAGLSLIQLALGFVTSHPAVSCALIGPRTTAHLAAQLAAADTVLGADVLDAVDAVVAPGLDLAPAEKNDAPPALLDSDRRRVRAVVMTG